MSMDAKPPVTSPATPPHVKHREKGIRIFMWPKVIYIFPSAIRRPDLLDRNVVSPREELRSERAGAGRHVPHGRCSDDRDKCRAPS